MMSRNMERASLVYCLVLFTNFCGGLCKQCSSPHSVNVSFYMENSFLSLQMEKIKLTLLTVHSDKIYTAGKNGLFHLSRNLEVESKHVTEEEENIYKILEVSESLEKLLACSSGGNQGCQLRNLGNVNENSSSTNSKLHEKIVAVGEFRTVAMIAPGKAGEGSSLYVARSIDLTRDDKTDRPVFERKLMGSGNDDRQTNVMHTGVKPSFVIYYSDVFSHGGFVYFLASQRDDATRDDARSSIVSKLSRICQNDQSEELKAFAELQLACTGEDGSLYSITQSARQVGNELFIVFSKNGEELHEYNPQPQSALCVYNLTDVKYKFEENSYACACNSGDSEDNSNNNYLRQASCGLLFTKNSEFACSDSFEDTPDIRDKFACAANVGSAKFFAYPEEPQGQAISADAVFEGTDLTFSSLSVTSVPWDGSQKVAFIGTKEGKLLKVNLNQDRCSNYEVVNVRLPILDGTTLYNNDESLLVLTESKLVKMKVAECSQFRTCDECVRPGSPLGDPYCGWCTLEKRFLLFQVNLNQDRCSNYEVVNVRLPILDGTTLYNNDESLLVLTESKLVKMKVAECSQFRTCDECVRPGSPLGDPYCGWCTLEKRCTRYDECQDYSKDSRWLPYNEAECVSIAEVNPKALAREVDSQELQLRITHLPELKDGESYECYFNDWRSVPATLSEGFLNCTSPPISEIPTIFNGDHVTMQLHIFSSETGENFVTRAYEFYDCSRIHSCFRCVDRKRTCDWCKYEHRCTIDSSTCRTIINSPYGSSNASADSCPQIIPGEKKYAPSGAKRSFTFTARNLPLIGNGGITRYNCHLTTEDNCCAGVNFESGATLKTSDNITFEITCDSTMYSYKESQQILDMKLSLKWNGGNTVDNFQPVQLYKCEVRRPDCSRCLSSITTHENLNCIWCDTLNTCTVESMCDGPKTARSNGTCPAPVIDMVSPSSSTLGGGTIVTVTGSNLGKAFEEVINVTLTGEKCTLLKDSYKVGESITCQAGPTHQILEGGEVSVKILQELGTKPNIFSYKNPQVGKFSPESGPRSGGTSVNITGEHLDTGGVVEVLIGDVQCTLLSPPTAKNIICSTKKAEVTFASPINVTFDGTEGGNHLKVTGTNFDLIQRTWIIATFEGREIASVNCQVKRATELSCFSPMLPHSYGGNVTIGFKMDGVRSLTMWTADKRIHFQYYDDPQYSPFIRNRTSIKKGSKGNLMIKGENIDVASRKEDVKVYIGKEQCNITSFSATQLTCTAPLQQPEAGDKYGNRTDNGLPFVIVKHGFLEVPIGYVEYAREPTFYILISIIVLLVLFLVFTVLIVSKMKRRSNQEVDILLKELEDVHNTVRNELKVFNDTLQMAVDNFDLKEKSKPQMAMIDRGQYMKNLLFFDLKIKPDNEDTKNTKLSSADETFFELIQNESFLIYVIRTMEGESELSVKQRVSFASFITVYFLLEGQYSFLIQVTKILMAERIRITVGSKLSEEAFQGCGSILNNIVLNIVRISLYDFLLSEIAESILLLQRAIKYVIEKGPVDAVTGKTQLSLSSSHLLAFQIEYEEITLKILFKYESIEIVELNFLSVDSITQVKSKILDHFFKGRQDQILLSPDDFDLVLHHRTDEKTVMRDDGIPNCSNGWRRINVIADYKVQKGDCVELVKLRDSAYEPVEGVSHNNDQYYNGAEADPTFSKEDNLDAPYVDYLVPKENSDPTFSKEDNLDAPYVDYLVPNENCSNKQSDSRDQSSNYESEAKHMPKIWHLIRGENQTIDKSFDQRKDYHAKALEDLTRSYLPVTGNMVQKYVKNVFDAFMTSTECHLPAIVKDIFDFFDHNAEKQRTPALAKKWKSNVLMLDVYSKILSKPSLIYNIKECSYVQVCLEILAQTLEEICTDEKQQRSDLSSNVQLYSHLVPVYRAKLDQYYAAIKETKRPHPKMLKAECEKVEKVFAGTFDLLTVKQHLCEMLHRHKDEIYEASRKDPELRRKLKSAQILS